MQAPIAARASGYLKRWTKDIGSKVERGELLAEIETPEIDQQLSQAVAARDQAAASLALSKSTVDRWEALRKKDVVSQQDLDERRSAVAQQQAIAGLKYGSATRLLLQCASRFWRAAGRPTAFGSDQPFGAVWDGNEQQRGSKGILSFLAGGRASAELRQLLRIGGESALLAELRWLGKPSKVMASRTIVWEDDEWARGGYAYFDPGFDPRWRAALSMPTGRLHFAGEHTSHRWQGYMNGALESGYRAAAEIRARARIGSNGVG